MLKLAMTALRSRQVPTIFFKKFDYLLVARAVQRVVPDDAHFAWNAVGVQPRTRLLWHNGLKVLHVTANGFELGGGE